MTVHRRRLLAGLTAVGVLGACGPRTATRPSAAGTASRRPTINPSPSSSASPPSSGTPRRAVEVAHGPRDVPRVALTFHGAGDPALAVRLLHEAERAGARVTVLAVGIWLDAHPGMARRILDGGHELGNHTLHHYPMLRLGPAETLSEIRGCRRVLNRVGGTPGRWFRASGTQRTNARIRAAAARAGYDTCLSYDVDTLDYQDPGPDTVVRNGVRGARAGSILSLHLGHAGTVTALPRLVDGLRQHRLTPVTVSDLLG